MLQVVGPFYPRLMIFVLFHSHCLNCVSTCGWWRWAEPGMNIPVSRLQSIFSTISSHRTGGRRDFSQNIAEN